MTIKIGDFVEVDFIGRIKGNGVFDTNIEEEAKKYDLYKENGNYRTTTTQGQNSTPENERNED